MRNRALSLFIVIGLLVLAVSVPAVQAGTDVNPRQLQASSCSSVKVGGKGHVLYRRGVSCSYAKRWVRKLRATRGRSKPRGFSCSSGSKFRGGGYCEKGNKHFGWYRGE
jgi:hypothetical protein